MFQTTNQSQSSQLHLRNDAGDVRATRNEDPCARSSFAAMSLPRAVAEPILDRANWESSRGLIWFHMV